MAFVRSDSELAEVLGHEIAHVDLRHAVEHCQYQYRLGSLVELAHRLATMPFSADQELDADAEGLRLAIAGGYDPAAAAAVFTRLRARIPRAREPARRYASGRIDAVFGRRDCILLPRAPAVRRTRPPLDGAGRPPELMDVRHDQLVVVHHPADLGVDRPCRRSTPCSSFCCSSIRPVPAGFLPDRSGPSCVV